MTSRPIVSGFPSTMGDDVQLKRGANALRSLGVGPSTRVGTIDWNSRRHFELYRAIPGLAAVMVQLNLRLGPEDLSYVDSDSGTSVTCVDESLLPLAEAVAPSMPGVTTWIVMSDQPMNEIHTSLPLVTMKTDKPSVLARHSPDELLDLKRKQGLLVSGVDIRLIDGYWRSGDVGTIDMENLLLGHPGIAEVPSSSSTTSVRTSHPPSSPGSCAKRLRLSPRFRARALESSTSFASGTNTPQSTQVRRLPTDAPMPTSKKY
ncbi:AMP-binding protein [Arthrobacter sp.]|uniref:AMP-binding protein n=1 Tax=Arthrobacter sp. TaxID=1667 RepID=UPI0026E01D95|nr:AMP-binding protein [Arthrobacter sp.]MDO5752903.1 AMP-binding protein [Arthrobacter sp.]